MNGYKAANHDFTIRHALENMNIKRENGPSSGVTAPKNALPNEHLWNTATITATNPKRDFMNKSRSEPTIPSIAVLEATNQFVQNEKQKEDGTKTNDTEDKDMYTEDEAKQLVSQFCHRFPSFRSKLSEQFPEEWLNIQPMNQTQTSDSAQIFQFSQLERSERERIIQELYEYGPAEAQK